MAQSSDKKKGPRPVEIAIAGVLSLILGVVGAAAYLISLAPEKVTELPAPEDRELGRLYYVEAKAGDASHDTWQAKKAAIETGRSGEMTVVEGELNRWMASLEIEEPEEEATVSVQPETPKFRIADDLLHVRVPLTWTAFGQSRDVDAQTSGQFVLEGDTYVLDYDRVYLGSCPLPGPIADRLFGQVVAFFDVSEELREGWSTLETVAVEGDTLTVVIP